MPPKVKVTKENIINTGFDIARNHGVSAINARAIASVLGCSTQPIFSNFATMDELVAEVTKKAQNLYREYSQREIETGVYPVYKSNGMAYVRFAKEERELFKMLFMCDRFGQPLPEENELEDEMESLVKLNTGLDDNNAKLFHLEVWALVHGIATMLATGFLDLDEKVISTMLTDCYLGLKKQYGKE